MTIKAILYARFSPRPKADESESLDYQFAEMRRYCAAHGYEVVGEYSDPEISGTDLDRPGLWAAVDELRPGYRLIVFKLDRLARGDMVLPYVIETEINRAGATLESCSNEGTWGDANDDQNWLVRRIAQLFAEYHRRLTVARTKAAMHRYQETGRRMSSQTMYGHRPDPDDPARTVLDEEEQANIERVLQLWGQLESIRGVARAMNEEGILYRGHKWYPSGVNRILVASGIKPRKARSKKKKNRKANDVVLVERLAGR